MNSEQFDKYFQSTLAEHEVKPPADVWEEVETQLPIRPLNYKRWLVGTALFMLLLSVGSMTFFNNYQIEINQKTRNHLAFEHTHTTTSTNFIQRNQPDNSFFKEFASSFNLGKQRLLNRLNAINTSILSESDTNSTNNSNKNEFANKHNGVVGIGSKNVNDLKNISKSRHHNWLFKQNSLPTLFDFVQFNNRLDNILAKPSYTLASKRTPDTVIELAKLDGIDEIELNELTIAPLTDFIKQNEKNASKGWYSGPTYQTQWSWLVNQNTKNESQSSSANVLSQKALPGNAFGVMVGYDFNKKASIQMEWILNSEHGFDFIRTNRRGETTYEYRQNLNYMLFPIMFKYRKQYDKQLFGKTMALNHLVGLQYGYLREAHAYINDEYIKADWQDRSNVGLVVGMGYDVYLSSQANFSIGARSTFGKSLYNLEGIFNDDQLYNVHFGINASLRYNFNK